MLCFCRIASYPCPRPQTLNISGFHKIQFICQHSLQVFILINQSSIIFTKDCREILKNPFIIIYEETPPWSREYCLQYFITPPSHPTHCWKLGGPKRGADPRVHVGGWDKLRQQRGQITVSWQRGPGYPSQFKRASVGVMWEWGLQSWSNFIRDIVDRHYRNQGKRQCRQGGESTERLVLTLVPPPSCEGTGAARKGALCASDFTQKKPSVIPSTRLISPRTKWSHFHRKRRRRSGVWRLPWTNRTVKSLVSHMVTDNSWATVLGRSRRKGLICVIFKTLGVFTVPALLSSTTGGTDLVSPPPPVHTRIQMDSKLASRKQMNRPEAMFSQISFSAGLFDITIQAS